MKRNELKRITGYHFELRQQLVNIYGLANDVFIKRNDEYPELANLVKSLFLFFDDLLFKFKKEEQILFPNIMQQKEKKLHEGHQNIFEQLQFFRTLTNDYKITEDMCDMHKRLYTDMKKFEQELSRHIYLEREILMPAVNQMDKNSSKRNTKNFNAQNAL